MPSLIRRHNGIYYGVFSYEGNRIWRSTGVRDETEARLVISELSKQFISWKSVTLIGFRDMLGELLEGTLAPTTIAIYRVAFTRFADSVGNLQMSSVQPYHIELFKSKRLKQVSAVKVSIEFRTLRAAFNRAVKFKMIRSNPFLECRDVKIPEKEPRALTEKEFERLIAVVDSPRLRSIILLAVSTMMRAGEIVNLKVTDIDTERGFIHLVNRDDFTLKGKRRRSIPLSRVAIKALEELKTGSAYVCAQEKALRRPVASISRRFKRAVRKAGLSEAIHFHSLRHTGATWLVRKGVPIGYIQKIMGHSTISMTLIYTQRDDEYLKQAVQEFDTIFLN